MRTTCSPANRSPKAIPTRSATGFPTPLSMGSWAPIRKARVACETLTTTNRIVIAGEVRGPAPLVDADGKVNTGHVEEIARAAVREIGYEQEGFHWQKADVAVHLHGQSGDIAQGVDADGNKDEGAGDQGIMFGYACTETEALMPAPIHLSHQILKSLSEARHSGALPFSARTPRVRSRCATKTANRSGQARSSSRPSIPKDRRRCRARDRATPCRQRAAGRLDVRRGGILCEPDRPLRDRRPGRRCRPDRPQDHCRYLWRFGAPWRRRVFGQGPDQSGPVGGLRRALSRQECRGCRPGGKMRYPARLRDRRGPASVGPMSTLPGPGRWTRRDCPPPCRR